MRRVAKIGRFVPFGLGFLAALAAILIFVFFAIAPTDIAFGAVQSDFARRAPEIRTRMIRERSEFDVQVLLLGDSMLLVGKGMQEHDAIPAMLNQALRRQIPERDRAKVYPFAFPGAGYTSFYFLSEELIAARPDVAVIELNLMSLSQHWVRLWSRPDHAAWSGSHRLAEALALPLYRLGLTLDRLLWTTACVEMGCANAWNFVQREQLRVSRGLELARAKLAAVTGMRATEGLRDERNAAREDGRPGAALDRRTAEEYLLVYGAALDGAPQDALAFRMLAATVRGFQDSGVPVVVYVNPVNVDGMKRHEVWNQAGIEQTLAGVESAVVDAGGQFVDLHDLLPDARFRDFAEHLSYRGRRSGQAMLVARLAPVVAASLRRPARAMD